MQFCQHSVFLPQSILCSFGAKWISMIAVTPKWLFCHCCSEGCWDVAGIAFRCPQREGEQSWCEVLAPEKEAKRKRKSRRSFWKRIIKQCPPHSTLKDTDSLFPACRRIPSPLQALVIFSVGALEVSAMLCDCDSCCYSWISRVHGADTRLCSHKHAQTDLAEDRRTCISLSPLRRWHCALTKAWCALECVLNVLSSPVPWIWQRMGVLQPFR